MTNPSANAQSEPLEEQASAQSGESPDTPEEAKATPGTGETPPARDLEAELTAMKDQWLRAVAECENIRRRAARDVEETSKYAVTGFARDMVGVIENLKRASDSIPAELRATDERLKTLGDGVDMTMQELLRVFEKQGIRRIEPLGEKFDHNFHQAVAQVESPDHSPGTVIQVLSAGYVIHDRLLRPAMVAVAKAPATQTPPKLDTEA